MGGREETISLMQKHGFVDILAWYQFVPWRPMNMQEAVRYCVPFMRGRISAEHESLIPQIGTRLAEEYLKVNQELKLPVGCHALMVYARKP